jgi:CHAD domain-containing protein
VIISSIISLKADEKKVLRYHRDTIRQTSKALAADIPRHLKMVNEFRVEMKTRKLGAISNDQILLYHELKADHLKNIFREPLDPEMLHEGRKQIKHILYLRSLVKPSTLKMIPLQYQHLDELQSLIGKWHDSSELLDSVREFKLGKNNKALNILIRKKKDQLDAIRSYRSDKSKNIFRS